MMGDVLDNTMSDADIRNKQILENTIDAIVHIDMDQKIIIYNKAAEKLWGYSKKEVVGKHLNVLIPKFLQHIHSSYIPKKGSHTQHEKVVGMNRDIEIEKKDGSKTWTKVSLSKIQVNNKIEYVAFLKNIDEQKKKELELLNIKHKSSEINALAKLGSWEYDLATKVMVWSNETYHLFGLSPEALSGQPSLDYYFKLIHPDDLHVLYVFVKKIKTSSKEFEVRYRQPDNTYNYILLKVVPQFEDNKLVRIIGINQDISSQKLLENSLIESKNKLEKLFNSVFEAVIIHADNKIIDVNKSCERLFGYKKEKLIGQPILKLYPDSEHKKIRTTTTLRNETPYISIGIRNDGTQFPMEVYAKNTEYEGNSVRIKGIRDLTALHNSEKNFRKNAKLLKVASEISVMGGWEYDLITDELQLTSEIYKIFEIQEGIYIDINSTLEYYSEKSKITIQNVMRRCIKSGEPFDEELIVYTKNGDLRYIRNVGKADMKQGEVIRIYGMIRDISDQKLLELKQHQLSDKLKKSAKLESIISKSDNFQELAENIVGFAIDSLKYCNLFALYSVISENGTKYYSPYTSINGKKTNQYTFEVEDKDIMNIGLLKSNKEVYVEDLSKIKTLGKFEHQLQKVGIKNYVIIPLVFKKQFKGFLIIGANKSNLIDSKDIAQLIEIKVRLARTLHRLTLSQLVEASHKMLKNNNRVLQQKNEELRDFSYIISHDLKAPLNGMSNILNWFYDDNEHKLDGEGKEQLSLLKSSIDKMGGLIEGILGYSKIGSTNIEKPPTDLLPLFKSVIKMLALPKNVTITLPKQMPTVPVATLLIQEVIQNILSNAVKYNDKENCEIVISSIVKGDFVEISIKDNGKGISLPDQKRIFGLFVKLDEARKDSSGVGLSIVKKIISLHEGEIWLESELGKETTFFFTLSLE